MVVVYSLKLKLNLHCVFQNNKVDFSFLSVSEVLNFLNPEQIVQK